MKGKDQDIVSYGLRAPGMGRHRMLKQGFALMRSIWGDHQPMVSLSRWWRICQSRAADVYASRQLSVICQCLIPSYAAGMLRFTVIPAVAPGAVESF